LASRILEFEGLVAGYANLSILQRVSGGAAEGAVTLLTGPNGAGKSTLLKTIFGVLRARSGSVRIAGEDVTGQTPRQLLTKGVAFVPEGRNLFPSLSVIHNLELGAMVVASRKQIQDRIEEVLVHFPRLRERMDSQASSLSGGEQKMLEVGRALLLRPRVLLVDEPSIGLSPRLVQEVFQLMAQLAAAGTTVLMVEQNVKRALAVCSHALAMESGRMVLDRPSLDLLADPSLSRLFLGGPVNTSPATPSGS